jgi:hypothetical protein
VSLRVIGDVDKKAAHRRWQFLFSYRSRFFKLLWSEGAEA